MGVVSGFSRTRRPKMSVVSGFSRTRRPKMSVVSGFSRTRRPKMYVVSGFSRTRRRTPLHEDIERRPVATPQPEIGAFEEAPVVVSTASEADALAWDAFVHRQPGATGYHEWQWRRG